MKDIKHIRRDFNLVLWVMPKGFGLGCAGGQKLNFLNMAMWHIKLKGMNSSPAYTEMFYLTIKLVTLGWGQRVNYPMARHRMCSSIYIVNSSLFSSTSEIKNKLFDDSP